MNSPPAFYRHIYYITVVEKNIPRKASCVGLRSSSLPRYTIHTFVADVIPLTRTDHRDQYMSFGEKLAVGLSYLTVFADLVGVCFGLRYAHRHVNQYAQLAIERKFGA